MTTKLSETNTASRSRQTASREALIDPASVIDYTFPSDNWILRTVTLRTALLDGRLYGRLIGTRTEWCLYSADSDHEEFSESHTFDVSTDYQDLEKVSDLPHRVALIPESEEIREFFAFPMVLRASKYWNDDDCVRKPAYDERMRVLEEAQRIKAARRASSPPGMTSYGTPMTPAFESLEETAQEDGEIAARGIDFAARYGRAHRVPGHAVAEAFYTALNKGGAEWEELAGALALTARTDRLIAVAQQYGPEAMAEVAITYREPFVATLGDNLRRLGGGGWPKEDPRGPIAPWLMLLEAMERDAKPSLLGRLFRR